MKAPRQRYKPELKTRSLQESTDYKKWLFYAKEDADAANTLMNAQKAFPNQAIILSLQSAEKSLKAYLIYKKKKFNKTHDLKELLKLCKESDSEFEEFEPRIYQLSIQPPSMRYPNKNSLINSEGMSNYKRKTVNIRVKNALDLYDFITKKTNLDEQTHSENTSAQDNESKFLEAVQSNDTELVELMLLDGANINARNANGDSALFIAVELASQREWASWIEKQESTAMVKLLLRKGADVNIQNNDGDTALFCAAGVFARQIVKSCRS